MRRTIVLETQGFCDLFAQAKGEGPSLKHLQKAQRVLSAWGFQGLRFTEIKEGPMAKGEWWKVELLPSKDADPRVEYVLQDITLRERPNGAVIYSSYGESVLVVFPEVLQWTPFALVTEINYHVQRVNVTE